MPYTVRRSESGSARTLIIENTSKGIQLDVDLVPALKFPEERWPISNSYRGIRDSWRNPEKFWLLVPKPIKNAKDDSTSNISRSWRVGLHVQERKLIHDSNNLRQAVRLVSSS